MPDIVLVAGDTALDKTDPNSSLVMSEDEWYKGAEVKTQSVSDGGEY